MAMIGNKHPHPHLLKLHPTIFYQGGAFVCDECQELMLQGSMYHCMQCSYDSCPKCFKQLSGYEDDFSLDDVIEEVIPVGSHSHEHSLAHLPAICYPGGSFTCDTCKKTFSQGEIYHCNYCHYFDLCPSCFKIDEEKVSTLKKKSSEGKLRTSGNSSQQTSPPLSSSGNSNSLSAQQLPHSPSTQQLSRQKRIPNPKHPHAHPLKIFTCEISESEDWLCDECSEPFTGPVAVSYHCDECEYDNCMKCYAQLTNFHFPTGTPAPAHSRHPHTLTHYNTVFYPNGVYTCSNCNKKDLKTEHYHCNQCYYDNCRDCYNLLSQPTKNKRNSSPETPIVTTIPTTNPTASPPKTLRKQHSHPMTEIIRKSSGMRCDECKSKPMGAFVVSYHCSKCDYTNCIDCYAQITGFQFPTGPNVGKKLMVHDHALSHYQSCYYPSRSYSCHICERRLTGENFHCSECMYDICITCYNHIVNNSNHIHPLIRYNEITYPMGTFRCSNCDLVMKKGPQFLCKLCNYNCCESCMGLISPREGDNQSQQTSAKPNIDRNAHPHQHPFTFYPSHPQDPKWKCGECGSKFSDERVGVYICNDKKCRMHNCIGCYLIFTNYIQPQEFPAGPHPHSHALFKYNTPCYPQETYNCWECGDTELEGEQIHCKECYYDCCSDCFKKAHDGMAKAKFTQAPHPHQHPILSVPFELARSALGYNGQYKCSVCQRTITQTPDDERYHCNVCNPSYDNCESCYIEITRKYALESENPVNLSPQKVSLFTPGQNSAPFLSLAKTKSIIRETIEKVKQQCRITHTKFLDTEFLPITVSLWYNPYKPPSDIEIIHPLCWRRLPAMSIMAPNPIPAHLFPQNGPSSKDIVQGGIGTSYLMGVFSVLTSIVPDAIMQNIFAAYDIEYGIYGIVYWQDGEWKNLLIDDFIPCSLTTQTQRPVPSYSYSSNDSTMWVSLLEKAYAKIHQCYENIDGGFSCYAINDLLGGCTNQIFLDDPLSLPVTQISKFVGDDSIFYLSFSNGRILGGGTSGIKSEMPKQFRCVGSYNVSDFTVFWDYVPSVDSFSVPDYHRTYKGKFDNVTNTITGNWVLELEKPVATESLNKYAVTRKASMKHTPFTLTQQFLNEEEKNKPNAFDSLHYMLRNALNEKLILFCSLHPEESGFEQYQYDGILMKHEYCIIDIIEFDGVQLVKLINPLKGKVQWKGDWSDDSRIWDRHLKHRNKYVYKYANNNDDGEDDETFCMSFSDFRTHFTHLNLSRVFGDGWQTQTFKGMITPKSSGLRGNKSKPKYSFKVRGGNQKIVISLSQPNNKRFENTEDYRISIGFRVIMEMKVNENEFETDDSIVLTEISPSYSRNVSVELSLPEIDTGVGSGEGSYFIIPITLEEDVWLPYILNIYTYRTTLDITPILQFNHPSNENPSSEFQGDFYAKWYYEYYVPEHVPYLLGEEEVELKRESSLYMSLRKNDSLRFKGKVETKTKPKIENSKFKGRFDLSKAKGRLEFSREKGRADQVRARLKLEQNRRKARTEITYSKIGNSLILSPKPPANSEAIKLKNQSGMFPDPVQDELERKFRVDFKLPPS